MKTKIITLASLMILIVIAGNVDAKNLNIKGFNIFKKEVIKDRSKKMSEQKTKDDYATKLIIGEVTAESKTMLENEKNYLYTLILSGTANDEQIARYKKLSQGNSDLIKQKELEGSISVNFTVRSDGFLHINFTNESDATLKDYVLSKLNKLNIFSLKDNIGKTYNIKIEFISEK